jgi:hypothetical protein
MSKNKPGHVLPDEDKKIAIANGLALQTVYGRIKRGWDIDKAINTPPTKITHAVTAQRDEEGLLLSNNRPKSKKSMSFTLYEDMEDLFNQAYQQSNLSRSEFIATAMEQYLLKLWKPKIPKKNY